MRDGCDFFVTAKSVTQDGIMPRLSTTKRVELEAFWRGHLAGWRRSELNQQEICQAHGLPLKRFGNWRAKFRS